MKFFVLFVLCWGVVFGTALSLVPGEERQGIPVDQPIGKFEENESKEELKKWELTASLFRSVTIDFVLEKSIDSSLHEESIIAQPVIHGQDGSRAPPLSPC